MSLFRSWIFVPGNNERRLEKAKDLQADVIIYDLEDAVALSEKDKAREMVRQAIGNNSEKIHFVRINDPSTAYFFDDVNELAGHGLTGIVLPKAAKREQILFVDHLLSQMEEKRNTNIGSIEIVPLIESAAGLYNAFEIAGASERIKRLAFGAVDFTLDINAQLTKEGTELLFARSQLVIASRAAGIEPPIDTVFVDIKDREGLLRDTRLAKQLGFQGKLVVHPDQIEVVNQVFAPTAEEIEEAKVITAAFDEALSSGVAAIQVNGKLVDYPVAARAKKIVDQAKALGK
ncbi:HpcH/HpaI aldolase/citrate lyase family protein [Effusibacillus lacus]|uniref:CoA ester lyase n=1 Tax=Effusibacillus lacus TaxID=1348429 RepID=A0A292YMX9_9BACL|nr:CoA ester lyase [Effusibacillus lacus]TCS71608.1 citrate lyase subunit beta/citryl-CoA lyase [Effusibacillus lacus]GAX90113.1 CoA ester lyase [Effusibacillus lacus]